MCKYVHVQNTVESGYSELIFARPVHYIQIVHYIKISDCSLFRDDCSLFRDYDSRIWI